MNKGNKNTDLKEKLKQALESTAKVISDDFQIKEDHKQNKSSKKFNFFNFENLNSKSDFIKARADSDSFALKKNSLMMKFTKKTYHLILPVGLSIQLLKK